MIKQKQIPVTWIGSRPLISRMTILKFSSTDEESSYFAKGDATSQFQFDIKQVQTLNEKKSQSKFHPNESTQPTLKVQDPPLRIQGASFALEPINRCQPAQ
jgi:hypothetical protein